MRISRKIMRRWMAMIAGVAIMSCGGILAWRQHFRTLARSQARAAKEIAEGEQLFRQQIASYQKMIMQNKQDIDRLRQQDGPQLPEPERELIRAQINLYEVRNQELKKEVESGRGDVKEFANLRKRREAAARRYEGAALRPWEIGVRTEF